MGAREAVRTWLRDVLANERATGLSLLAAGIAVAVVSPLLWLLAAAAERPLAQLPALLLRPAAVEALVNSLALVAAVTAGSVLLGVPLAVLVVRTDLPFRRLFTITAALPIVLPSYIGAFAFVSAFGPQGLLTRRLGLIGDLVPPIYGFVGTALVLTLFVYPYVFLGTRAALLTDDPGLIEAARTLNRDRLEAFRAITLPRILPGIAGGALLVALYTLADFGTPAIMHFDTFTRVIFVEATTFARDLAALLSLELLGVTAVILALESRIGGGTDTAGSSRGHRGGEAVQISLGRWRWPLTLLPLSVAGLTLVLPLAVLFVWLLRPAISAGGLSFEWGFALNSVGLSAGAAILAALAAIPVAYLAARRAGPTSTLIERATYLGYAMPGVVLGLALVAFGTSIAPVVYQTIPLLLFAYVVRFLPQAVSTIRSSLLQVDRSLLEAARTLGHPPGRAFRRVTLPLVAPGIVAGAGLVFLTTMKELPATLLLHPTGMETLVSFIWVVQDTGAYGKAAVPALALVGLSGLSLFVLFQRGEFDV